MAKPTVVQLEFQNPRSLLSEGQGRRTLISVSPHLATVADLAADIVQSFNIDPHACPHGITLCMDGVVVPPGESTAIFRDNDVVRVKKKAVPRGRPMDKRTEKEDTCDIEQVTVKRKRDNMNETEAGVAVNK